MKKLALILLGVLIGVVGSHLMNPEPEATLADEPISVPKATDQKRSQMAQEPEEEKVEQAKPEGWISPARAKELSKAYNSRYEIVSKHLEREDNRSVWFSVEEMETFLGYTKYEAQNLLEKTYVVNGVRVYLAAYPEKNPNQDKAGYTTVFMVPTYDATKSRGNVLPWPTAAKSPDIPGGSGLNEGGLGHPPSSSYPN